MLPDRPPMALRPCRLELSRGRFVLVDAEDAERLSKWRWTFDGRYAVRYTRRAGVRSKVYMHRELLATESTVDHANGDGLDNRRANLRPATRTQQLANTRKRSDGRTSRYKGVRRDPRPLARPWIAEIRSGGVRTWLGRYATEDAAAAAYAAAAHEAFGPFARPASR